MEKLEYINHNKITVSLYKCNFSIKPHWSVRNGDWFLTQDPTCSPETTTYWSLGECSLCHPEDTTSGSPKLRCKALFLETETHFLLQVMGLRRIGLGMNAAVKTALNMESCDLGLKPSPATPYLCAPTIS